MTEELSGELGYHMVGQRPESRSIKMLKSEMELKQMVGRKYQMEVGQGSHV